MPSWFKRKNTRPDAGAVAARAIILKHVFVKGLAICSGAQQREQWGADEWSHFWEEAQNQNLKQIEKLRQSGLWNVMEREERNFMEAEPAEVTQQEFVDAIWRAESIVCLLWALGFVSELSTYDQQANPELTNKLPVEPAGVLIKKATLRPQELIEKQRNLAELWHWRSRTRQLQESGEEFALPEGMTIETVLQEASAKAAADGVIPTPIKGDFPAFGKPYRDLTNQEYSVATSIAMERHRALNWLCGFAPGNRWAETPTDT